jgi:PAS domain-containing protein
MYTMEADMETASSSDNRSTVTQEENNHVLKKNNFKKEKHYWQKNDSSLVTDIRGRIKGCGISASKILCRQPDELAGLRLEDLIPELPLSPDTPFYNLAYAVFQSKNGLQIQRTIQTDDGRKIPINISLSTTVVRGKHLISLTLNPSDSGATTDMAI